MTAVLNILSLSLNVVIVFLILWSRHERKEKDFNRLWGPKND